MDHNALSNIVREIMKIAFFGDSITEGCFELVYNEKGKIENIYDKEAVYWALLKKKILINAKVATVEITNAGVAGDTSANGLLRLQKDVIDKHPDLTVVCFGLNDACMRQPEKYAENMSRIFDQLKSAEIPTILMTPNMMNTYIHQNTLPELIGIAKDTSDCQNSGIMDLIVKRGKECAKEYGCYISDAYIFWKRMEMCGIDTTALLCNRINHPSRDMHHLFADLLYETIMENRLCK